MTDTARQLSQTPGAIRARRLRLRTARRQKHIEVLVTSRVLGALEAGGWLRLEEVDDKAKINEAATEFLKWAADEFFSSRVTSIALGRPHDARRKDRQ